MNTLVILGIRTTGIDTITHRVFQNRTKGTCWLPYGGGANSASHKYKSYEMSTNIYYTILYTTCTYKFWILVLRFCLVPILES